MYKEPIINYLDALKSVLTYIEGASLVVDPEDHVTEFKGCHLWAFLTNKGQTPITLSWDGMSYRGGIYFDLVLVYPKEYDTDKVVSNLIHASSDCGASVQITAIEPRTAWVHEKLYDDDLDSSNYKLLLANVSMQILGHADAYCVVDPC